MKKLLFGCAVLPCLAGVALAGQPAVLNDVQMDKVTAGATFQFLIPAIDRVLRIPNIGSITINTKSVTILISTP